MEEEGAHRKVYGAGNRGFLAGLDEDDEEEDGKVIVEEVGKKHGPEVERMLDQKRTAAAGVSQPRGGRDRAGRAMGDGRAGVRDLGGQEGRSGGGNGFSLDMGNSSILGRRHRRVVEPSPLGRFGGGAGGAGAGGRAYETVDAPQSPMRGVEV